MPRYQMLVRALAAMDGILEHLQMPALEHKMEIARALPVGVAICANPAEFFKLQVLQREHIGPRASKTAVIQLLDDVYGGNIKNWPHYSNIVNAVAKVVCPDKKRAKRARG